MLSNVLALVASVFFAVFVVCSVLAILLDNKHRNQYKGWEIPPDSRVVVVLSMTALLALNGAAITFFLLTGFG